MGAAIHNLDDALEGERIKAPTRDQIGQIKDTHTIWSMISYAEDQIIAITTVLEYFNSPEDDKIKRSRVAALIYWKQARKNLGNRMNQIKSDKSLKDMEKQLWQNADS